MDDLNHSNLAQRIEAVTSRFWQLTSETAGKAAVTQIAGGLSALLDDFEEGVGGAPLEAISRVIDQLEYLAVELEHEAPPGLTADSSPTIDVSQALSVGKFVEAFQKEAQRRMAGLSLSLTGVFDSDQKSIDQTVAHLHAIRGGAGMLGLDPIARLSGAMEDVILATSRSNAKVWPVRALLRGFATLESAVDDPDGEDHEMVMGVADELRSHLQQESRSSRSSRSVFDDAPITDVRKEPLQRRILVVDDVETIAHSVGLILSELDIPIDVSHSGAEALEALRGRPYSLVISDVAMPEMTGLDLTREIRADENLSDLPVILLTALDKEDERIAGLAAGADDYIVKGSIGGGELVSRVAELLQSAPVVPPKPLEEGEFRKILIAEDIETIAASIAFVLSEGPYEITLAHHGQEALDMLRDTDFDLVISDLQMPQLDGFGLLKAVQEDESLSGTPIVLLTSRDTEEERETAASLGAARYLIKGEVGGGSLLQIVAELIS